MSSIASFIRDLFQNLLSAFVNREVSRVAVVTTAFSTLLVLLSALATGLFLAIQTGMQSIVYTIQTPELQQFIGAFWPPHYSVCLSVILTAKITRWVYDRTSQSAELYWSSLTR